MGFKAALQSYVIMGLFSEGGFVSENFKLEVHTSKASNSLNL